MPYSNIRELLPAIGLTVLDVTQQDELDWMAGMPAYFTIHFSDGLQLTVIVEDDQTVIVSPAAGSYHRGESR